MLKWNRKAILLGPVAIMVALGCITATEGASNGTSLNMGLVSLSDPSDMCKCTLLQQSCTCCQSVTVNILNDTKTLCLTIKLSVLAGTMDLTATMDGTSVGKYTLNVKQPPTACLPLISVTGLNMCIKLNFSMSLSGAKICPNVYSSFNTNEIMSYTFPCVQIGMDGVSMV